MKARVGGVDVEGTPEEIGALIRAFSTPAEAPPQSNDCSDQKYVSEDVAFKVLKRRPLSKEQVIVLRSMLENYPDWTTAKDLHKATKYSPMQLAGLLGAFGKRVASTEGYVDGSWFFDQEWDYENDCNRYRLPAQVSAAVRRALS